MARPDPRKLKDDAAGQVTKGKWQKALDNYLELERLEKRDGTWPQRSAEMLRRLGRSAEAIEAYIRAADVYSGSGFLLKAIAVCKLILEIDPARTDVEQKLAGLHAANLVARPPRVASIVVTPVAPEGVDMTIDRPPPPPLPRRPPPPPAAPAPPLEHVKLSEVVPGSRKSGELMAVGDHAAYEIPLGEDDIELIADEPSAEDTARAVFPRTPLFSALSEERLRQLIAYVGLKRLAAGEVLFRRGDPVGDLYVVSTGEVAVLTPAAAGGEIEVGRLGEGAFFGEIALITSQPRSATIQGAADDTELIVIPRQVVLDLMAESPEVMSVMLRFMRDRLLDTLVDTNPLFAPFSGGERRALAERFRFLEVEPEVALLTQGKRATGLTILLAGSTDVILDGKVVAQVPTGGIVGETSLLTGAPALATVVARTKVLLLFLPRTDFQEVIMTHPQVLEAIGEIADDRRRQMEELTRGVHGGSRVRVV